MNLGFNFIIQETILSYITHWNQILFLVFFLLIIVAITISAVGILWYVVNTLIESQTESSECINTIEKVLINNYYTCNDSSTDELRISVELKDVSDINVSKVVVQVYGETGSVSFEVPASANEYDYMKASSGGTWGEALALPSKNSAKVYYMDVSAGGANIGEPSIIKVTPVVGNHQCGVSDTLTNIESC